jgi:hypothetical protein
LGRENGEFPAFADEIADGSTGGEFQKLAILVKDVLQQSEEQDADLHSPQA